MMTSRPVVVVLAAGSGSRFTGPVHKLGQDLGGASVLARALRHALASHLPVVVVTTEALAEEAQRSIASRDIVVLPPVDGTSGLPLGMGFSIAAGVSARPNASGWLIQPGDMPLVQPSTFVAVSQALADHPVAFAQHQGRRGHPVGFAAELYSELSALTGDDGARRLVARYPSFGVELDDPGVLLDIDTEADLHAARASEGEARAIQPTLPG